MNVQFSVFSLASISSSLDNLPRTYSNRSAAPATDPQSQQQIRSASNRSAAPATDPQRQQQIRSASNRSAAPATDPQRQFPSK
eukprot:gene22239-29307_t